MCASTDTIGQAVDEAISDSLGLIRGGTDDQVVFAAFWREFHQWFEGQVADGHQPEQRHAAYFWMLWGEVVTGWEFERSELRTATQLTWAGWAW